MKKYGYSFELFNYIAKNKRIVVFSASSFLQLMAENFRELDLGNKVKYIVDNDSSKVGGSFMLNGIEKEIRSIDFLLNDDLTNSIILIGSDRYAYEIFNQLEVYEQLSDVPCFVLPLMISNNNDDEEFSLREVALVSSEESIPKIIHCFWLGGGPIDSMAEKCLESFKKFCPDYKINLWTHDNYDVTKNKYMYDAYNNRKWAYACDYARLDKLYHEGGIYFDLDVELVSNIDIVLQNEFFAGFGPIRDIELAAFGARPGHPLIKEMLDAYEEREFVLDHELGLADVQPIFMDRFLEKKGFEINGKYQKLNGCTLYPREVFSPRNWFTGEENIEENTLGIHHCAGSWATQTSKNNNVKRGELLIKLEKMFE